MSKLRKNYEGFAVIELLLVLIIIILICFIGWFIYHTDHKTTPPATTNTGSNGTLSSKNLTYPANYFTIKEWNVRAPYSGSLTLEYSISNRTAPPSSASFSSAQLDASDANCKGSGNSGGLVERYAATDTIVNEDGSSSGQTATQFFSSSEASTFTFKHIGNYYYWYVHPQGLCGTSQSSQNLETQTDNEVKTLVQNLQAIPS